MLSYQRAHLIVIICQLAQRLKKNERTMICIGRIDHGTTIRLNLSPRPVAFGGFYGRISALIRSVHYIGRTFTYVGLCTTEPKVNSLGFVCSGHTIVSKEGTLHRVVIIPVDCANLVFNKPRSIIGSCLELLISQFTDRIGTTPNLVRTIFIARTTAAQLCFTEVNRCHNFPGNSDISLRSLIKFFVFIQQLNLGSRQNGLTSIVCVVTRRTATATRISVVTEQILPGSRANGTVNRNRHFALEVLHSSQAPRTKAAVDIQSFKLAQQMLGAADSFITGTLLHHSNQTGERILASNTVGGNALTLLEGYYSIINRGTKAAIYGKRTVVVSIVQQTLEGFHICTSITLGQIGPRGYRCHNTYLLSLLYSEAIRMSRATLLLLSYKETTYVVFVNSPLPNYYIPV